ncbi:hypothetical protein [Mucilaginibacter sp.]|uniref:carboxylesterase family protein n=1 Tax=Mucilaginibacter sp. TaxID=1882438 RepID=UPI003D0E98D3
MNRSLYIILIVFLGLTTVSGIWSFVFGLQMGAEIYKLGSFISWFILGNIIAFTASIILLKYYYDQNYRFAFYTGIISVIINLVFIVLVYIMLTTGELESYYLPAILLSLLSNIVYALGLIFSGTRTRFWLKLAGVCGLLTGLVVMLALIGRVYTKDAAFVALLGKITQWSPLAWNLVNVLFIMNLLGEMRALKTETVKATRQQFLAVVFGLVAIVAIALTIKTGGSLITERDAHVDWRQFNAVEAQQLVGLAGGAKTYVDKDGDSLHYLLIKPMNYDKKKKYPLVVCLPYGGYEAGGAEFLSTDFNRYTYRAFILVPFCPEGEGWGGIAGNASLETMVYETINKLNEPGIDIKRRYVTGVSRGGYGTWEFICTHPDMFAAAIPVSGAGDPDLASKIVNMPIWAFHGAEDKNVPVSGTRDMIAAIKKAGGYPIYTEYVDGAHNIWENVIKTPDLLPWLFAQKQK